MARTDAHERGTPSRPAAYGSVSRSDRRRSRHRARQALAAGCWDTLAEREHARPIAWQCGCIRTK